MNKNATGLFEGDNLLNQIVNISKAAAYDVTVENVKELQAQNDALKIVANEKNERFKDVYRYAEQLKEVLKEFMYNWDALGNANDYSHVATKAYEALNFKQDEIPDLTGNTDNHIYKFLADENRILKQPTKVLVYVKDGTVSTISSNIENIRIVVIDEDNIGDEKNGFISEPYEPDAVSENLYELFSDSTDPIEMEIRDELKRMKF